MAVVRWTFTDLQLSETYVFPINPSPTSASDRTLAKSVQSQSTTAPGGEAAILLWEGADEPQTLSWGGVILYQDHYEALATWYRKRHQIQLTDDLDRTFVIYIAKLTFHRGWKASHPWRHTYDAVANVLEDYDS